MIEILKIYRRNYDDYPHGGCDDHRKFILHLLYRRLGNEDNGIERLLMSDMYNEFLKEFKNELSIEKPVENRKYSKEEVYYYYASRDQRIELKKKDFPLTKRKMESREVAEMYGFRSLMYTMGLTLGERESLTNDFVESIDKDEAICNELTYIWGIEVHAKYISQLDQENDFEIEEDMFGFFDNEDEINNEFVEKIAEKNIDYSETIFETSFEEFNNFGKDVMDVPRRIWDPGGASRIQDPGRIAPTKDLLDL
jgi:hypothetical protein